MSMCQCVNVCFGLVLTYSRRWLIGNIDSCVMQYSLFVSKCCGAAPRMNSVGVVAVDTFEKEEQQGEDIAGMEAMCVRMNSLDFATSKVEDFALQIEPAFNINIDIDQESAALAGDRPFAGSIEVVKKCRGDAINCIGAHIVNRCLLPVYAALFVPRPSSSSTRVDTVCQCHPQSQLA